MRSKDLRAFQILEEFETNRSASQRQLARKLNVSLGLMNAAVKDLEGQGLFTIEPRSGNRNQYILTPEGLAEKSRLGREYVRHSLYYYGIARDRITALLDALENDGSANIGFCGIGFLSEIAYICLQQTHLRLLAVIEEDSRHERFFDVPVISMQETHDYSFDAVLVTAIDSVGTLIQRLTTNGLPREKVQLLWN